MVELLAGIILFGLAVGIGLPLLGLVIYCTALVVWLVVLLAAWAALALVRAAYWQLEMRPPQFVYRAVNWIQFHLRYLG